MANLSSKTGFTPVQTQIALTVSTTVTSTTSVQDFAAYNAQELTGFIEVLGSTKYRTAVKVMVVKNGADAYEVASVDIAGDNYSSAPLVSFSMSGTTLRATLPAITGATSAKIQYQLSAPALGGQFPLTVDGSNVTSATTSAKGVITLKAPTQTKLTSGSGTYTVPAGVLYLKVKMVGGGGGGSGSGTSGGTGGTGGASTFGSSLLTANGGGGGQNGNSLGGAGGSSSIAVGTAGVAFSGGAGNPPAVNVGSNVSGGSGGSSAFGGNGGGAWGIYSPSAAPANTGGGGGGGGTSSTSVAGGSGGGAGGYVDALISAPAASYAYAVGAAGSAGAAGTSGYAGAAGGSGIIVIDEYYY